MKTMNKIKMKKICHCIVVIIAIIVVNHFEKFIIQIKKKYYLFHNLLKMANYKM